MASKAGRSAAGFELVSVEPHGTITDAGMPQRVMARVAFRIETERTHEQEGWALAWTRSEVLVCWHSAGAAYALWLPARDVRRV